VWLKNVSFDTFSDCLIAFSLLSSLPEGMTIHFNSLTHRELLIISIPSRSGRGLGLRVVLAHFSLAINQHNTSNKSTITKIKKPGLSRVLK